MACLPDDLAGCPALRSLSLASGELYELPLFLTGLEDLSLVKWVALAYSGWFWWSLSASACWEGGGWPFWSCGGKGSRLGRRFSPLQASVAGWMPLAPRTRLALGDPHSCAERGCMHLLCSFDPARLNIAIAHSLPSLEGLEFWLSALTRLTRLECDYPSPDGLDGLHCLNNMTGLRVLQLSDLQLITLVGDAAAAGDSPRQGGRRADLAPGLRVVSLLAPEGEPLHSCVGAEVAEWLASRRFLTEWHSEHCGLGPSLPERLPDGLEVSQRGACVAWRAGPPQSSGRARSKGSRSSRSSCCGRNSISGSSISVAGSGSFRAHQKALPRRARFTT